MPVARFFGKPCVKCLAEKVVRGLQKFLANPETWWKNNKYTMLLFVIVLVAIGAFTE